MSDLAIPYEPILHSDLPGHPDYLASIMGNPLLEKWWRFSTQELPEQVRKDPDEASRAIRFALSQTYHIPGDLYQGSSMEFFHPDSSANLITGTDNLCVPLLLFDDIGQFQKVMKLPSINRHAQGAVLYADIGLVKKRLGQEEITSSRPMGIVVMCSKQIPGNLTPFHIKNHELTHAIDSKIVFRPRTPESALIGEIIAVVGEVVLYDPAIYGNPRANIPESWLHGYMSIEGDEEKITGFHLSSDTSAVLAIPPYKTPSKKFLGWALSRFVREMTGSDNVRLARLLMQCDNFGDIRDKMGFFNPKFYRQVNEEDFSAERVAFIDNISQQERDALTAYYTNNPGAFNRQPRSVTISYPRDYKGRVVGLFHREAKLNLSLTEKLYILLQDLDRIEDLIGEVLFDIGKIDEARIKIEMEEKGSFLTGKRNVVTVSW